jgi:hydroxypyruvate isomerase
MTFMDVPFMERFDEAARSGFNAVDLSFPDAVPQKILARRLRDCRLTLIALDLPTGDYECEGWDIACDPDRVREFRTAACRAIDYASEVGCRLLNCRAGALPRGISLGVAQGTLIENLRFVGQQSLAAGIRLLVEATGPESDQESYVRGTLEAVAIVDAVGVRNIGLLYNVSSMQSAGEPVEAMIGRHLTRIDHVQVTCGAEDGATARWDHHAFYNFIDGIGYHGWVGCGSAESIEASLAWMSSYDTARRAYRWGIPVQAFRK